jgi:HD-like signal output (HDOD) protein
MSAPARHEAPIQHAIAVLEQAIDSAAFAPPMLPVVAQEALALSRDRSVDLAGLGRMIERDQVLAARFLTVANSPAYRRRVPTNTVSAALMRLGLSNSRDLLFFSAVEPILFTSRAFEDEMTALRSHSLGTAVACGWIARKRAFSGEYASLAGLIHDLGAAAVVHYIGENREKFAALRSEGLAEAIAATHVRANQRIAKRWALPEPVARAVGEHHDLTDGSPFIVVLTAAADELATACGLGSGLDPSLGEGALARLFHEPALVHHAIVEFGEYLASEDHG